MLFSRGLSRYSNNNGVTNPNLKKQVILPPQYSGVKILFKGYKYSLISHEVS